MRIHGDSGMAKGGIQNDIGRFTSHTGQTFQCMAIFGYLTVIVFAENFTCLDDVFSLGVKQANGFDMLFQPSFLQCQDSFRGVGDLERWSD